ncbi:Uma2 family endonuclease [Micromonospora sp. CPCC 206061]|uniref:Uma2 family endonuclease n=1 Tax=Micromonospora sp. CPCC 206061 TaxID=3122410 RepID=UPI002FF26EE5
MTAQPTESAGRGMWSPDPLRQRLANYTIEDVLELPDDAPRVELRDGVIIVVPSPTVGHQDIGALLWMWLRQHAPAEYRAVLAVGVAVTHKDTFEPDVVLLRRPVEDGSHYFDAAQVLLAVEVVSPGTKRRDRLEKPGDYAAAGVQHFWRIEQNPVHIFAYELAGDAYKLVADATDELALDRPFNLRLPIRDITP